MVPVKNPQGVDHIEELARAGAPAKDRQPGSYVDKLLDADTRAKNAALGSHVDKLLGASTRPKDPPQQVLTQNEGRAHPRPELPHKPPRLDPGPTRSLNSAIPPAHPAASSSPQRAKEQDAEQLRRQSHAHMGNAPVAKASTISPPPLPAPKASYSSSSAPVPNPEEDSSDTNRLADWVLFEYLPSHLAQKWPELAQVLAQQSAEQSKRLQWIGRALAQNVYAQCALDPSADLASLTQFAVEDLAQIKRNRQAKYPASAEASERWFEANRTLLVAVAKQMARAVARRSSPTLDRNRTDQPATPYQRARVTHEQEAHEQILADDEPREEEPIDYLEKLLRGR